MEQHKGSKQTYDTIATWEPGPVPISKNGQLDRMGIIGVLGYLALNFSKGAILEIGIGESSVFLGELAKRYKRQAFFVDLQASVSLNALTIDDYFGRYSHIIMAGERSVISPDVNVYIGSSDDFFKEIKLPPLAFVFVDGDHNYEQTKRDFDNILPFIEDTGIICLHDTYPPSEEFIQEAQCGTVYKLRQELQKRQELDVFTFIRGAMDVGLTICRKKQKDLPEYQR